MCKMPGYVIHLAVGKVYEKNNKIEDIPSFERGIIAPDLALDKSKSHYGPYSSRPDLNRFLRMQGISSSYQEGYFLHLVTDFLFYNKFLTSWDSAIYEDYDRSNARIMCKYGIVIPEEIQRTIQFKEGTLRFFQEEELYGFIDLVGKINIRQMVLQKDEPTISL